MYYTQEDSVLEVRVYKHTQDIQIFDLIFSQLNVFWSALPRGIHRERVSPEKKMSPELSCL
jgi:hypothetical protein